MAESPKDKPNFEDTFRQMLKNAADNQQPSAELRDQVEAGADDDRERIDIGPLIEAMREQQKAARQAGNLASQDLRPPLDESDDSEDTAQAGKTAKIIDLEKWRGRS